MARNTKSQTLTRLYHSWQATAPDQQLEFVDKCYEWAEQRENYEDSGGDFIVECLTPQDIFGTFENFEEMKRWAALRQEMRTEY